MFEYAANGHHYWTADQMMAYAEVANGTEAALRTKLGEIRPEAEGTVSDFFKLGYSALLRQFALRRRNWQKTHPVAPAHFKVKSSSGWQPKHLDNLKLSI